MNTEVTTLQFLAVITANALSNQRHPFPCVPVGTQQQKRLTLKLLRKVKAGHAYLPVSPHKEGNKMKNRLGKKGTQEKKREQKYERERGKCLQVNRGSGNMGGCLFRENKTENGKKSKGKRTRVIAHGKRHSNFRKAQLS